MMVMVKNRMIFTAARIVYGCFFLVFFSQVSLANIISEKRWPAFQKDFRNIYELIVSRDPVVSSVFNIFLIGNTLFYVKEPCEFADVDAKMILHIIPSNKEDLPEHRKNYSFDNLDFDFISKGMMFSGKCITASGPLPDYDISAIRIGQYIPGNEKPVWVKEFAFPDKDSEDEKKLNTHLYSLGVTEIKLKKFNGVGGAIEKFGDNLLLATPDGSFALVHADGTVRYLDERVPMGLEDVKQNTTYLEDYPAHRRLRVSDILVRRQSQTQFDLFVTHHYYTGRCVVFRLSQATLHYENNDILLSQPFRTVFDASPCISLPFDPHQSGGKIVDDNDFLLIIIGDHGQDGWHKEDQYVLANDLQSQHGKLVRVEIETGKAETLTIGHRNPQGLVRDQDGNLWAVEHGPQGGDELNLLLPNRNYGWPSVTYGVDYGGRIPIRSNANEKVGSHDGFTRPHYAWVPSIGVASIAVNRTENFPLWKDDLLITSLASPAGGDLFRVRRHGRNIQYVERIKISERIRDIAHTSDGRIALLLDKSSIMFLARSDDYCHEKFRRNRSVYALHCWGASNDNAAANIQKDVRKSAKPTKIVDLPSVTRPAVGEQLFGTHCGTCHRLNEGEHDVGPHLHDVIGRRAGEVDGYFNFSPFLQFSNVIWTKDNLKKYIASPQRLIPGTTMPASDITEKEADSIVEFLSRLSDGL